MGAHTDTSIPRFTVTGVIAGGFFIFFALSAFFSFFMNASDAIKAHLKENGAEAVAAMERGAERGHGDISLSIRAFGPSFVENATGRGTPFLLEVLGIGLIICLSQAYHYPVKRFFRNKRRGEPIPPPLEAAARERLSHSPIVLGVFLPAAMIAFEFLMIGAISGGLGRREIAADQLRLIAPKILLAAMAGLFMYLWQRHRVQSRFLRHAYSKRELTERMPPGRRNSIRGTLALVSFLTAILPAAVSVSLIASGFSVVDSSRKLTAQELDLLFGQSRSSSDRAGSARAGSDIDWTAFLGDLKAAGLPGLPLLYFDTLESWRLVIGMAIGLSIVLGYAAAIVRWVSSDFILPLEELSSSMQRLSLEDSTEPSPVTTTNELGDLALGFNAMLKGLEERNRLKGLFGQYLTREVSEAILAGRLNLDGDRYQATVMFTDIRNFTAMSESMDPGDVFRFLNGYFDTMIEAIMSKGGFIDKFIGDGILSVFGLPVRGEDHARLAVEAAMEMRGRLEALNRERRAASLDPIAIGSGIHTGPVIAGNVGNEKRAQFTVIGDTVNLASRLEGLNKRFASSIILSDSTWAALPEELRERGSFERLSDVEVRGKKEPLTLYKAC
jgi:class 3 adenylate cyclase